MYEKILKKKFQSFSRIRKKSFIHWTIHSFIHWTIHSFIHWTIHSFTEQFIHSLNSSTSSTIKNHNFLRVTFVNKHSTSIRLLKLRTVVLVSHIPFHLPAISVKAEILKYHLAVYELIFRPVAKENEADPPYPSQFLMKRKNYK